jgi:hypothetical protein
MNSLLLSAEVSSPWAMSYTNFGKLGRLRKKTSFWELELKRLGTNKAQHRTFCLNATLGCSLNYSKSINTGACSKKDLQMRVLSVFVTKATDFGARQRC